MRGLVPVYAIDPSDICAKSFGPETSHEAIEKQNPEYAMELGVEERRLHQRPGALQHIFQTSGYHYPKRADADQIVRNIVEKGIASAVDVSEKEAGDRTFNVSQWLAQSTLDAMGVGRKKISLHTHIHPTREYIRFRAFRGLARSVAKGLVEEKAFVSLVDATNRDITSVLFFNLHPLIYDVVVRANVSEDQLDEDGILSQMQGSESSSKTIILAGHETTASTLAWLLYELSRHPEDQKMMREKIQELRYKLPRGTDFTVSHPDSMTFTNACMKVGSLTPPPYRPCTNGETLTELPIQKGQDIIVSICAYNRLPSVRGSDADEWNSPRFLAMSKEKQMSVGVCANLMTFSAGIRACIGWRFAIIELKALVVEAVENFKFVLHTGVEIMRLPAGIVQRQDE
ncbi:cytochrome P450 [Pleurotus eryngii]|uniref:Cytochrome P450 n=1 Tax=Pleurotus eryngii TaxID=5323 RepID=A0A9P6DCJ2_PLEER|nr:cytochrome P450 [Pleurotus eryngii]